MDASEGLWECEIPSQILLAKKQSLGSPLTMPPQAATLEFLTHCVWSFSSPIFEEDTPSVMEIEMEELDKWMSTKRGRCLPLPLWCKLLLCKHHKC